MRALWYRNKGPCAFENGRGTADCTPIFIHWPREASQETKPAAPFGGCRGFRGACFHKQSGSRFHAVLNRIRHDDVSYLVNGITSIHTPTFFHSRALYHEGMDGYKLKNAKGFRQYEMCRIWSINLRNMGSIPLSHIMHVYLKASGDNSGWGVGQEKRSRPLKKSACCEMLNNHECKYAFLLDY